MQILNELQSELESIFLNGSKAAISSLKLKKISLTLEKLGLKSALFKVLFTKVEQLIQSGLSQVLLEISILTDSILATQSEVKSGDFTKELSFKDAKFKKLYHSKLSSIVEILNSNSQKEHKEIEELFLSKEFDDVRLYKAYINSIGSRETYVNKTVLQKIIPEIGEKLIPLIEEKIDLNGDKSDARLFKTLYQIKGRDILPLSKLALQNSSSEVLNEVIKTLGEDESFEETLIEFTKNKKGDFRKSAFEALAKMNSSEAEVMLIENIKKSSVTPIEEALILSSSQKVSSAIVEELKLEFSKDLKKGNKVYSLLLALSTKNDIDSLTMLRDVLTNDELYEKYNNYEFGVYFYNILYSMIKNSRSKLVDEFIYYEIVSKKIYFYKSKIELAVKLFDKVKVYDELHTLFEKPIKFTHSYNNPYPVYDLVDCIAHTDKIKQNFLAYNKIYEFLKSIKDEDKFWDRRWGELLTKSEILKSWSSQLYWIDALIYDDDKKSRNKFLTAFVKDILKINNNYYHMNSNFEPLVNAFRVDPVGARKYFDEIIEFLSKCNKHEKYQKHLTAESLITALLSNGVDKELLE